MPITIEIVGTNEKSAFDKVFGYFQYIDEKFSTYKVNSEISRYNRGELKEDQFTQDLKEVFNLCDETKKLTNGYFEIRNPQGIIDPSGLVKGWAVNNAAKILMGLEYKNFYIDAGGDIQAEGLNEKRVPWQIGIRNPIDLNSIIKVLSISGMGVATSGTYIRGEHIYNPKNYQKISEIVSLTVIGKNIYEADRFATAAFAMGKEGIVYIENLKGFEGYMVDKNGLAVMTTGFEKYVHHYKNR